MSTDSQDDNPAYPETMEAIERELIKVRRGQRSEDGTRDVQDVIGIGLSGGGIRSATFCLGLFQGLVKQKLPEKERRTDRRTLLSKIDYMSTVSGGGYFGAFYGRLFTRDPKVIEPPDAAASEMDPGVTEFKDIEEILTVHAANDEGKALPGKFPPGKVFRWLRENGQYLAPNGSGDLLLGGAVFIRNAIAVQIVWGTFLLMLFLFAHLFRGLFEISASQLSCMESAWRSYQGFLVQPWETNSIWWSPYAIFAAIVFLFRVVPPAWSYWLIEKPDRETAAHDWLPPIYGIFAVLAVASAGIVFAILEGQPTTLSICVVLVVVALVTRRRAIKSGWRPAYGIHSDGTESDQSLIDENEKIRNLLSRQLQAALVVLGAVLAFVMIDSLAQTGYGAWVLGNLHLKTWVVGIFGPLIGLVGFARTILSSFGGGGPSKKISLPVTLLAGIAAIVVGVLVLTAFDFGAYAIAWNFGLPSGPRPAWKTSNDQKLKLQRSDTKKIGDAGTIVAMPSEDGPGWEVFPEPEPTTVPEGEPTSFTDLAVTVMALFVTVLFSLLFGLSWPFLNRSTYHPIYTSRLIRAYLGASNPKRLEKTRRDVTETIDGDDSPQETYWPRFAQLKPTAQASQLENTKSPLPLEKEYKPALSEQEKNLFKKGMPIHLVSVTINETIDAASQIEQHDRKGTGMAIGPAGLSVGVKHHLVLKGENKLAVYPQGVSLESKDIREESSRPFQVFNFKDSFRPELLTLGNWTGISGAAFSTSLGWRTSLSFSLLAGLANVRLSYWWDSGTVNPQGTGLAGHLSSFFQKFFSVQDFLFDEFLARFHGTARQYWPLSDGGHFENMGGYELIRRRLPMIIIVDAEADADYTFEGLANLVRKARLDFGAEIRFLTEYELDAEIHTAFRRYFGTLDQLRRGRWVEEPIKDPVLTTSKRLSIDQDQEEALSLAHVALAKVTYQGCQRQSTLLYIKPTLIGDEPADVRRYHTEHPSFPHETTAEQFFDEAQWESYRRLGEHIADKVFRSQDGPNQEVAEEAGKFVPYRMKALL